MGLLMTRLTIDIWKLHDLQLVIQLCDGYPKISPRPLPAGRLFCLPPCESASRQRGI
jgi:hypothetical protein